MVSGSTLLTELKPGLGLRNEAGRGEHRSNSRLADESTVHPDLSSCRLSLRICWTEGLVHVMWMGRPDVNGEFGIACLRINLACEGIARRGCQQHFGRCPDHAAVAKVTTKYLPLVRGQYDVDMTAIC